MTEAANELKSDPVSVDGLDHVFVDVVTAEVLEGIPTEVQAIPQEIPEGVPVEEAARLLGTSTRAVIKRLQKGTLKGYKVPSKYGDKWLVDPKGIPRKDKGTPQDTPASSQEIPQGVPVEIVQELLHKVEALTYRNGYLEAQLAEKEVQIRLLTDSQSKAGRWRRFASWFLGQR